MKRVSMVWSCSALVLACASEGDGTRPRQAEDLQAEYEAQAQSLDQCLADFETCTEQVVDPAAIGACAGDLQACLGGGLGGGGSSGTTDDGGGTESGTTDDGGSESGTSDDGGGADPGDGCDAILDGCLADPFAIDPTCFDDYEQCVQGEIDADLQGLCDELEAECQQLGIPNFDCTTVCP